MTRQMADDEVLRPCPFCGEAAEFVPYKRDGLTLKCKSFGCAKFSQRVMRHSLEWLREKMAESWNNRPAVAALQAERDALRAKTAVTLGVGSGGGSLFVHGDYDSIKAAQDFIFRAERAESALEALRGQVAGLGNSLREMLELREATQAGRLTERHELDIVRDARAELLAIKERMG